MRAMSRFEKSIAILLSVLGIVITIAVVLFVLCREIDYTYEVYSLKELNAVITAFKIIVAYIVCVTIFMLYLFFKYK